MLKENILKGNNQINSIVTTRTFKRMDQNVGWYLNEKMVVLRKSTVLNVWRGSEYASAEKQGKCKVSKNNSWRP